MHAFYIALAGMMILAFSLPPAIKVLAVAGAVYGILQALKQPNALTPYIKGWVAICLNVLLSAGGVILATPADQLYTSQTVLAILAAALAAAGVHGTITLTTQNKQNATKVGAVLIFALLVPMALVTGCKPASTTTPPAAVAPGYQNATDQQLGETIAGATGFYNRVQADIQAGTYKASPNELTSLNIFGLSLNSAKLIYGQYHAGQATLAQAQAAVNKVQQQQAQLQATITAK